MIKQYFFSIFLFLIIITNNSFSQDITVLDTANLTQREDIAKSLKKRNKAYNKELSSIYNSGELGYVKPIYNEINKDFNDDILKGDYIFYKGFDSIINDTHVKLTNANPGLQKECMYFVSRDITLNAMSTVYNTFVINIGSFYFLNNRDEFAALIAHEQAHNYLKHQITSLKNACKTDKNIAKTSVDNIKKSRYGRGTKAIEQIKSLLYSRGKINRQHEFEADSLGYLLYKNAGYKPGQYLSSFKLMMEYDSIKTDNLDISIYKKVFNLPGQPFKEEWLKMEDFSGYDYSKFKEKINEDSIKSHPETEERLNNLKRIYPELKNTAKTDTIIADKAYKRCRNTAFYEVFQSMDISEDYGFGVFVCLVQLNEPESNTESEMAYYKKWLGKYFTKIHKARKEYTLNRYLDKVDPKNHPKDYQQFLNFMWNLKLTELEQIALYYSK